MRLNRFLASCGLGSRRGCEQIIREGRVSVDGKIQTDLSTQVSLENRVKVDGRVVEPESTVTIAIHKPRGSVTTRSDEKGRETVYDLLPAHLKTLHHIGRLDKDSEGLLLLTNDGDLSLALTHPKHGVEKEYLVTLDRAFEKKHLAPLLKGIKTEEGLAIASGVETVSKRRLAVVLKQGLKRQIRLMFAELGYKVRRLVRLRIGPVFIRDLAPGRWRHLSKEELRKLRSQAS